MNNKSLLVMNSFLVFIMLLIATWAWNQVPDTQLIPVHYDINGLPDRYGGKFEGLLVMPLIGVILTVLFAVIPRIEPRSEHLNQSEKAYSMTALSTIGILFSLHTATVLQVVLGWQINIGTVALVGVSLLLVVMGNYLSKVRSNCSFGIRTPWTLASERSWNKTHRLGGRLLFLLGVSGAIVTLVSANAFSVILILVGTISITIFLVVYSYLVWKEDPQRQRSERL